MPITVELQNMYNYSIWIVLAAIVVVLIVGVLGIIFLKKSKKPVVVKEVPKQEPRPVPVPQETIKQKYARAIDELEKQYRDGKISNRKAYQRLSVILRKFVHELTGVKVHNYTLMEINQANMPNLSEIIDDCYAPEFSVDKDGDFYNTMNKARMVIEQWHS